MGVDVDDIIKSLPEERQKKIREMAEKIERQIEPRSICNVCAAAMGAEWPKEHRASSWVGKCSFCDEKTRCTCMTDWKWDEHDSSRPLREV